MMIEVLQLSGECSVEPSWNMMVVNDRTECRPQLINSSKQCERDTNSWTRKESFIRLKRGCCEVCFGLGDALHTSWSCMIGFPSQTTINKNLATTDPLIRERACLHNVHAGQSVPSCDCTHPRDQATRHNQEASQNT